MPTVNSTDFVQNLTDLLRETFEGTNGGSSHYIDGRGRGSFLETLDRLSADEASTPLAEGGATIAAHVEHTRYYMSVLRRFIDAEPDVRPDWPGSWTTRTVTDDGWTRLKAALRDEYDATLAHLAGVETWDDEPIGGYLSVLAHGAYHLGAVRLLAVTLDAR